MGTHSPSNKEKLNGVLETHNLFRLKNFSYLVRDCLFDSLQVLLHFTYTSVQLRKGTIEYFRKCLEKQDAQAIISYQHELHEQSLIEMYNVNNQELYLEKMTKSTSIDLPLESRGLWRGIFCIHWLSNLLKIPIRVW